MSRTLSAKEVQERLDKFFVQKVILNGEYKNRRTPINLKCLDCGHEWTALPTSTIYGDYQHKCPNCGTKKGKIVKCAYCGKEIYRSPAQLEKSISGYYYCSHTCGNLHKNILREKQGEWDNSLAGYRSRALKRYPHKCAVCGWDEDDRVLQVHHKDENRKNNSIDNLVILCPNCHWKITLGLYLLTEDNQLIKKDSGE